MKGENQKKQGKEGKNNMTIWPLIFIELIPEFAPFLLIFYCSQTICLPLFSAFALI
jgi:hypothetical protein